MKIQLNIGMETNNDKTLTLSTVLKELSPLITNKEFDYKFEKSDTENTLIIRYQDKGSNSFIELMKSVRVIANKLHQDCIALKIGEVGQLIYSDNPKNDWGTFSEDYFINY